MHLNNVQCLFADNSVVWCGTNKVLFRLESEETFTPVLVSLSILCLEKNLAHSFPLCGTSQGLYLYTAEGWIKDEALGSQEIRCLLRDEASLWCGTNRGLFRQVNGQWQNIPLDPELGIPFPAVNCLLAWRNQIWCGTEAGLLIYDQHRFTHCLVDSNILSLFQDYTGTFWCGTSSGLIMNKGRWSDCQEMRQRIECIVETQTRTLWAGAEDGLWKFSDSAWSQEAFAGQSIRCMLSAHGKLWSGNAIGLQVDQRQIDPKEDRQVDDSAQAVEKNEEASPASQATRQSAPRIIKQENPPSKPPQFQRPPTVLEDDDKPLNRRVPISSKTDNKIFWKLLVGITCVLLLFAVGIKLQQEATPEKNYASNSDEAAVENAKGFYTKLSITGALPAELSSPNLRKSIESHSDYILKRDALKNMLWIPPIIKSAPFADLHFRIELNNTSSLESLVTMKYSGDQWVVDRVRYMKSKAWQCLEGAEKKYISFDSEIYVDGVAQQKLKTPCPQ